ncbi:MAG TPA: hypothetical protein VLW50_28945 [Streptosporangiaceae bacterium]|nr:hypothetical protein [Streptosporangiaceae bacterium]
MKLSMASTLVAASAAAAVIGLGAPAFASTGAVAHPAKVTCGSCSHFIGGPSIFRGERFRRDDFRRDDFRRDDFGFDLSDCFSF